MAEYFDSQNNDLNFIRLIKDLTLLFTRDFIKNDTHKDKETRLKAARSLQKIAFDILLRSSHDTQDQEDEWYPEIRIADFAYALINEEEEIRGRKLLEDIAQIQHENFVNLDNIWCFLLNLSNFKSKNKSVAREHPFSLSGNDYFFRDVSPYSLLPYLHDHPAIEEDEQKTNMEDSDLFLDLFIEESRPKRNPSETGPSLCDFVDSTETLNVRPRNNPIPEDNSHLKAVRIVKPASPVPATTIGDEFGADHYEPHEVSKFSFDNLELVLNGHSEVLERHKGTRKKEKKEVHDAMVGIHVECCNVRQIVEPSYQMCALQEITVDEFIMNGKFLLCGVDSSLFQYDDVERLFYMKDGVYVRGITPDCLFEISKPLLEAGTFFKRVSCLVDCGLHNATGILQPTFWKSVDNHLVKYREAVTDIADKSTLMGFKQSTAKLERVMVALNKLCSPKGGHHPRGGLLLTHLYELCCAEQQIHVQDVFFSILLDCCIVYMSKLVEKWIFQGLQDVTSPPEFFIKVDGDLCERQDRYYAYQSVGIDDQLVPSFLAGLVHSIYSSGKAVWLLKMFDPENSFIYFMESLRYPRLKICITEEEFSQIKETMDQYQAAVETSCGTRVTFLDIENEERQLEEERRSNIKITREKIMAILKEKRVAQLLEQEEKMKEKERVLKKQLEVIAEKRKRDKEERFNQQKQNRMDVETVDEKHAKSKEETARYYQEMSEAAEQMRREADWQSKRLGLHEKRIEFLRDDVANENTLFDEEGNVITGIVQVGEGDDGGEVETSDQNSNNITIEETGTLLEEAGENDASDQTNNNRQVNDQFQCTEEQWNNNEILGIVTTENQSSLIMIDQPSSQSEAEAARNKLKCLGSDHFGEHDKESTTPTKSGLSEAENNKLKMMSTEYDFNVPTTPKCPVIPKSMTEAMRNKLKVLGSEYYMESTVGDAVLPGIITEAMRNKLKIMGSDYATPLEAVVKKTGPLTEAQKNKLKVLGTEFDLPVEAFVPRPRSKPTEESSQPFAVEAEPLSPQPPLEEPVNSEPIPITKAHIFRLEAFEASESLFASVINSSTECVTFESVGRDVTTFARLLQRSLSVALKTQERLANSAVLKHFILKEDVMTHIGCLRRFFLHYDGQFSRNLTQGLFHALARCLEPSQFFDKSLLSGILNEALLHSFHNSQSLSFQIIRMPTKLKLETHCALTPFQLSYLVKWPLNIIITDQAIERYRKGFHFLVNLKRVHWTLNETFLLLKTQTKDNVLDGKRLMNSPEYTKLATYRHAMTLFIMTLEEHCTNGLQEAWQAFMKNLHNVQDLEQLYQTHVAFVKDFCKRCFLAKATNDLLSYIHEMIELGLQFHYILKSSRWRLISDAHYSHPKYDQLKKIFRTFCKTTKIFYHTLEKKTQHADLKIHIPMLELIDLKIKI